MCEDGEDRVWWWRKAWRALHRSDYNITVLLASQQELHKKLNAQGSQLEAIVRLLTEQQQEVHRMAVTVDDILAGVQQESTVDDSIITLLNNIVAQLANAGVPQATLDQINTVIQANIAKVSGAVTANTPAAPPAPGA